MGRAMLGRPFENFNKVEQHLAGERPQMYVNGIVVHRESRSFTHFGAQSQFPEYVKNYT